MTQDTPETKSAAQRWLTSPLAIFAGRLALLLTFLVVWQLGSGTLVPRMFVSDPISILNTIAHWIADGSLWIHLGTTLLTLAIGYALGAAAGISLGFLLGMWTVADRALAPFIAAFYGLPKAALLPLFVIFLGIGIASKVALVAIVVLFLLFYNTRDGVRDVDPEFIASLRLLGATRGEILRKVILPSALPWVYTGLRIALGYALTTTVVGEVLSSNRGIGFLIESSAGRFNSAGVFAAVVVLVILSLVITATLTRVEVSSSRWRM
jgi:NitT/TauT family transport system permease protein